MARLQLDPDHDINMDNRLGKLAPESPQSPGAESQMSFNVYDVKVSGSENCLGALPNSASTIGFLPDHRSKGRMGPPAYSKRIRQLTIFLTLFVIVSLVMTGLFVWRAFYYKSQHKPDAEAPIKQVRFYLIAPIEVFQLEFYL